MVKWLRSRTSDHLRSTTIVGLLPLLIFAENYQRQWFHRSDRNNCLGFPTPKGQVALYSWKIHHRDDNISLKSKKVAAI